jgi:hypothetical protein
MATKNRLGRQSNLTIFAYINTSYNEILLVTGQQQ